MENIYKKPRTYLGDKHVRDQYQTSACLGKNSFMLFLIYGLWAY